MEIGTMSQPSQDLYVVRQYDGFDNEWIDITGPVSHEEAQRVWDEKTEEGTKNTTYNDIDYYKIFPADTKMVYSAHNLEHNGYHGDVFGQEDHSPFVQILGISDFITAAVRNGQDPKKVFAELVEDYIATVRVQGRSPLTMQLRAIGLGETAALVEAVMNAIAHKPRSENDVYRLGGEIDAAAQQVVERHRRERDSDD
jgi:hypothetical protein